MALEPRPSDYPRIRKALTFYKVTSVITGVMLLLLCAEMLLKYVMHYEIFAFGPNGILTLEHLEMTADGSLENSMTSGVNVSTGILIAHGWFYVLYLFGDFRLWSLMRWPFTKFLLIAAGGVVPFLSFVMEVRVAREVTAFLDEKEGALATTPDNAAAAEKQTTPDTAPTTSVEETH
ncbi:DUF3817 domain-containing protein [Lysinibacter cavernae]|uniref:Integral membrane protein n=1 Tax=Lysinibacter cavernae TaxID=1640652 RepID=A0A7X5R1E5_9MICO|nr:DUF3817 domain-containing protein [Lysinibacter cavernae]NIH53868.1 integral membrane protein [Lysinibacter cavernae]